MTLSEFSALTAEKTEVALYMLESAMKSESKDEFLWKFGEAQKSLRELNDQSRAVLHSNAFGGRS